MNEVKVGVIGLGNMGKYHCGYINEVPGARLTAVCDSNKKNIENLYDTDIDFDHGIKRIDSDDIEVFTDYNKMFQSGVIDLVIVAVPHFFHSTIVIDAFKNGIHVICEKPLTVTASEALKVIEEYRKAKVVFSVMFQERISYINQKIKAMIDTGELGEIKRINWIKTDWFRTQKYYNSGGWRGTWNGEGGGVLINQAVHDLDLFQWFFGLPKSLAALVYLGKWHDIQVEDDVTVMMEMENGATAIFITTTGDTPGTSRLEIIGEKGKLVYEDEELIFFKLANPVKQIIKESEIGFYKSEPEIINIKLKEKKEELSPKITGNVVNSILYGEKLIVPGEEGLNSVQLINTILVSGIKKHRINFPVDEKEYLDLLEELKAQEKRN